MHYLVYHIPFFISSFGCIKKFSGQVVDQSNNIKMIHQRKSASCSPSSETFEDSPLGGLLRSVPPKQLYLYKYCHIFMFFTHKFYKYCPSILRGLMEITEMFFRWSRIMQRWVFPITNFFLQKITTHKRVWDRFMLNNFAHHEEWNDPSAPSILDTNKSPEF